MEFRTNTTAFAEAVYDLAAILPSAEKPKSIADSHLRVEASHDGVTITSAPGSAFVQRRLPATVARHGSALIRGRKLSEWLKHAEGEHCDVQANAAGLTCHVGASHIALLVADSLQFPSEPALPTQGYVMEGQHLREALSDTLRAVRDEKSGGNANVTSLHIHWSAEQVRFIGLDGFWLAQVDRPVIQAPAEPTTMPSTPQHILIPHALARMLERLLTTDDEARCLMDSDWLAVLQPHRSVRVRLAGGPSRNLGDLLPNPARAKTQAIVETAALDQMLRRLAILGQQDSADVAGGRTILSFERTADGAKLLGEVEGAAAGGVKDDVDVDELKGEKIRFGVNTRYLRDALNVIKAPYVRWSLTSETEGIRLDPCAAPDRVLTTRLALVMPVRITK